MSANNKQGLKPQLRTYLNAMSAGLSGDLIFNILLADVTPAPTAAAWSYTINFEIVDSNGNRHEWFDGDVGAAVADDSTAGTASVDDATPPMVNGIGTVVLSGDAADWLDTEEATVTLSKSLNGNTVTGAVFTVTFTA